MSINKEKLAKNQFWILFGVVVPILFFTMIWLKTVSANRIEGSKKELAQHLQTLDKHCNNPPRGEQDMKALVEREETLKKRQDEIWKSSWDMQKELMTWPGKLQAPLGDLKFGDTIDVNLCSEYVRPDMYHPQYEAMVDLFKLKNVKIGPAAMRDFEFTQFKGGWKKVFVNHVGNWAAKKQAAPSSEEVWLAQEDVWVQREAMKALREAIDLAARFNKVEGPSDLKPGELYRKHFKNADWQLDLIVGEKAGRYFLQGRIKNITEQPQMLGKIFFQVQLHQGNAAPVVLPVEADTIAAGKDAPIAQLALDLANRPDDILAVTQLYELRDTPIRRIEQVIVGEQAHRTFDALKMHKASTAVVAALPPPAEGVRIADRPNPAITDNGLSRERYADITDQVRRVPVAIVALVDQGHIPEVLAALASSRFRFQITQVSWQHFRGSLIERDPDAPKPVGGDPKGGNDPGAASLVELTIHCVASLYERYQPPQGTIDKR